MGGNRRPSLTAHEHRQLRELLRQQLTLEEVAERLGFPRHVLRAILSPTRGMASRLRPRSSLRLSVQEREEISRGLQAGDSLRAIARALHRAASTVSREVTANGGPAHYRAWNADQRAMALAHRPKPTKFSRSPRLRRTVEEMLAHRWSPQQISRRLVVDHPGDLEMRVSHETIYRSLFVQGRGALRAELAACLRTGRAQRRPHRGASRRGHLKDMVLVSERPPEAADRAVPGHWEGDLILGKGSRSAIGTLVERQSRYVLLLRLPNGRSALDVRKALVRRVRTLPAQLRRSLTWDQGGEMAEHVRFSVDTGMQVYFCDPHSPWQRGTSENTNGLLRQYFPKGVDVSVHTQAHLDAVARELNGRPRQALNWMKPSEVFAQLVAVSA